MPLLLLGCCSMPRREHGRSREASRGVSTPQSHQRGRVTAPRTPRGLMKMLLVWTSMPAALISRNVHFRPRRRVLERETAEVQLLHDHVVPELAWASRALSLHSPPGPERSAPPGPVGALGPRRSASACRSAAGGTVRYESRLPWPCRACGCTCIAGTARYSRACPDRSG